MDTIAKLNDTEISRIVGPTRAAFQPYWSMSTSTDGIKSIPTKTFKYGATERHQLDVYYPPPAKIATYEGHEGESCHLADQGSKGSPVLCFVYSGGFTTGERILPNTFDMVYANLGAYFARKGFIVVIPDYRLVPNVKFPGPPEDIRDAIAWVVGNLNQASEAGLPQADTDAVFLMGHSAGAAHASTMVLYPDLAPVELKQRIKGVVLISGPYDILRKTTSKSVDLKEVYWSGEEDMKKNQPLSLIQAMSASEAAAVPRVLMVEGEWEPEWVQVVGEELYAEALKKGVQVEKLVAKGHNHISLTLALSTGQGEDWAERAAGWMMQSLGLDTKA
ncbi:hypothetical protein PTI98_013208 [Pleurotus ostreatus]|nr:hypothetical protein PTI98_013208 [Pleurotus ostreatus]